MPGAAPERADKALSRRLPELAGWRLRQAFAKRDVKRSGKPIPAGAMVAPGDVLEVYIDDTQARPLSIVFEDDDYVVINKRQGMAVQGEGSVEAQYARQAGAEIFACHRLDVQTGGLVLLAKHPGALALAEEAFAARTVQKTYQAVVRGEPRPEKAHLRAFLRKDEKAARVRIFDRPAPGALPIETRYRTMKPGEASLLEIDLITGRTHQIRAHLAHIGHPIVGDDKYGDRAFNRAHGARRQKLWAVRLVLWDGRAFSVEPEF